MSKYIEEVKEQINIELGRVSAIFMIQGETMAKDIVMPTEELAYSSKRFETIVMYALQKQIEMIEGEMQDRKDTLIGPGVHPGDVYTQGRVRQLDDILSTINQYK